MKLMNIMSYIALSGLLIAGCKSQKGKFEFLTPGSGESLVLGEKVAIRMQFADTAVDSVVYSVDGEVFDRKTDTSAAILDTEKIGFGARNLVVKAYVSGKEEVAYGNVTIVAESPKQYTFKKVASYPHDTGAFTQGLEYENGNMYESTGAGGELITSLRKVDLNTGKVLKIKEIKGMSSNENPYFGEGMTIVGNRIVMLTWLNNEGFVFDKASFEQIGKFNYQNSKQGWGLAYDGNRLIKTDSSNKLYFLDPNTYEEKGFIEVYDNNGPVHEINELEYIDGKLYANIYQKDYIVIINPNTGVVEGQINLMGMHSHASQVDKELNGIAYNKEKNTLYVTGKQWDTLYEIEVVER